jgi:hypothetical protein
VREVHEEAAVRVERLRTDRHAKLDIVALGAMLVRALAVNAASTLETLPSSECGKIAEVGIGDERHVAALAPVSPIGPALRDELLTTKTERTVASASSPDLDPGAVTEHG